MSLYPEYEKSMPIFRQSNIVLLFRKHLVTFESREFDVQFGSPFSNKKKMLELDISHFPRFPTSILISFYTLSREKLNCHTYQLDFRIQAMLNNT